jgi:S1-C subfamily serine protease
LTTIRTLIRRVTILADPGAAGVPPGANGDSIVPRYNHDVRALLTRMAPLTAAAICGGLIAVLAAGGGTTHDTTTVTRVLQPATGAQNVTEQPASAGGMTPAQIYRQDAPGVVVVRSILTTTTTNPFGLPQRSSEEALGSGFVIDSGGHILTNAHVVTNPGGGGISHHVTVSFQDPAGGSTAYPATVLGADPLTDVAVLHVNVPASALRPLPLGDSRAVQVGDPVAAIGNPLNEEWSITTGIVSAINRTIDSLQQGHNIPGAIQTDAAINHGNSGGPLIDSRGQVIGITSQILAPTASSGSIGIGFAVPINLARRVAQEIIATGRVEHTYLGIKGEQVTAQLARDLNLPVDHGVLIAEVEPNSPASRAGLHGGTTTATIGGYSYTLGGDVIVAIDGTQIHEFSDLTDAIAAKRPGQTVVLEVYRDGHERTVSVTLGETTQD